MNFRAHFYILCPLHVFMLTARTNLPENLSTRVYAFKILEYFYAGRKHDCKQISNKTCVPEASKPCLEIQGDKERRQQNTKPFSQALRQYYRNFSPVREILVLSLFCDKIHPFRPNHFNSNFYILRSILTPPCHETSL